MEGATLNPQLRYLSSHSKSTAKASIGGWEVCSACREWAFLFLGKEPETEPSVTPTKSLPHLGLSFPHQTVHCQDHTGDFRNTGSWSASRPTKGAWEWCLMFVKGLESFLPSDRSEKLESN